MMIDLHLIEGLLPKEEWLIVEEIVTLSRTQTCFFTAMESLRNSILADASTKEDNLCFLEHQDGKERTHWSFWQTSPNAKK